MNILNRLTPRQIEVALLLAGGYNQNEIAELLCLTRSTVSNHILYAKMRSDCNSTPQLAAQVAVATIRMAEAGDGGGLRSHIISAILD